MSKNHNQTNDSPTYVTVEFICDDHGKFDVMKIKSTLVQLCSCGKQARPIRIMNVITKRDDKWFISHLENSQPEKQ